MVAVLQAQECSYQSSHIQNLSSLPARIRNEIQSAQKIQSFGSQELTGDDISGNIVWSAEGYWYNNKFVVTNYGSHSCHWDGQSLRNTVRVYA
jgi:hypothetical protein